MPKNTFITKDNKNEYNNYINNSNIQLDKDASYQETAYVDFMRQQAAADANTRTGMMGGRIEDSPHMVDFKRKLRALTSFYTETPLPAQEETFQQDLMTLDGYYAALIDSANKYIQEKSNFWKKIFHGQGYARLEMVKKLNAQAQKDRARLKKRAQYVFDTNKELNDENARPLWANVLAELRHEKLAVQNNTKSNIAMTSFERVGSLKKGEKPIGIIERNKINTKPEHYRAMVQYKEENGGYIKTMETLLADEDSTNELYSAYEAFCNEVIFPKIKRSLKQNQEFNFDLDDIVDVFCEWTETLVDGNAIKVIYEHANEEYTEKYPDVEVNILTQSLGHYCKCYCDNIIDYDNAPMSEGSNIPLRKVLNYRLAELLGLEGNVQESTLLSVVIDEKDQKKYIASENVNGYNLSTRKNAIFNSRQLKLQINSLELFDFIAGQVNRQKKDFRVIEKGSTTKIKLVNNQMSFGLQDYKDMLKANGLRKGHDLVQVPQKLADRILAISDEALDLIFIDALNQEELKALKSRIHGVQKWLNNNLDKIVRDDIDMSNDIDFEQQTNTYLNHLIFSSK